MRISRLDTNDPAGKKRRYIEISINSPVTILDCRASRDNLALPEYMGPNASTQSKQHVCSCPNTAVTHVSPAPSADEVPTLNSMNGGDGRPDGPDAFVFDLARSQQEQLSSNAVVHLPIHMLRNPSYNPTAYDAEHSAPLATPLPLCD
ncbi:hypothetical protein DL95DRAFT_462974 [Leptodontidium sp. 2 PMI_412]|nr:hypothetical protein DL95DRAFT_462974 [Leptodontidium sp. 2 PMI_412]